MPENSSASRTMEERKEALEAAKEEFMQILNDVQKKHGLSEPDLITVLAFSTGAACAFQNPRKFNADEVWRLIVTNIEAGNNAGLALAKDMKNGIN